jgi:hypothetical protein
MHGIEIIIRDDSTVVIEEAKRDFCCDWVEEEASGDCFTGGSLHHRNGGGGGDCSIDIKDSISSRDSSRSEGHGTIFENNINGGEINNKMNPKPSPSMQQAAAFTKAPLLLAANRAKTGFNRTLTMFNNDRDDSNNGGKLSYWMLGDAFNSFVMFVFAARMMHDVGCGRVCLSFDRKFDRSGKRLFCFKFEINQ